MFMFTGYIEAYYPKTLLQKWSVSVNNKYFKFKNKLKKKKIIDKNC